MVAGGLIVTFIWAWSADKAGAEQSGNSLGGGQLAASYDVNPGDDHIGPGHNHIGPGDHDLGPGRNHIGPGRQRLRSPSQQPRSQ